MNKTRKLLFFVGRLFVSTCSHSPTSLQYFLRSRVAPLRAKDLRIKTLCIRRNFSRTNENKPQQVNRFRERYEVEDEELPSCKEFLSRLPTNKEYAESLMKVLGCNEVELNEIRSKTNYWSSLPFDFVVKRLESLYKLGVQENDLMEHPSVIFVNYDYSHALLISLCSTLGYNGHTLFPLLLLKRKTIQYYLKNCPKDSEHLGINRNRIRFFSIKLKVPARTFTEVLVSNPRLLTTPIDRITQLMDIFLDAGVDTKDLLKDLGAFKGNVALAKQRMDYCREAGLKHFKPWMARCSDKVFWRSIERRKAFLSLSQGLSKNEFVAKLLSCSVEKIQGMANYNERVLNISYAKYMKTINFLLSKGFTSDEILQSPQVFLISLKKLERTLNIMQNNGLEPLERPEILRKLINPDEVIHKFIKKSCKLNEKNCNTSSPEAS